MKKIWHISDLHTFQDMLTIPEDIDIVICSGDVSNSRDIKTNEQEIHNFIDWYSRLNIEHKIFVAGNHDLAIERNKVTLADFVYNGIIYLEDDDAILEGIRFYGSPWTPTFGVGWAYNRSRDTISKTWDKIPENTDIVITHGPPKGILDLSYNREGILEFCGDAALKKRMRKIEPKLVCFGHIHNYDNITNQGYTKLADHKTIYSNGSIVTDGRFGQINNNGNIFEI